MNTELIIFTILIHSTSFAAWQVAPLGDSPDRLMKFIPRNPNIPDRAPIGERCMGGVIKKIDDKTSWVYMRRDYSLAAVCEWVGKAKKDKHTKPFAGWQVAPFGNLPDRPLKFISRNPNIPERAPIGEPCMGGVIKKIDDKTSWVYMRRNHGLAAVCEWTAKSNKPTRILAGRTISQPKVETLTLSHAYDATKIPPEAAYMVSYIRWTTDGSNWSAWRRRRMVLTGCTKYQVRKALKYEYREAYANSYGMEGPSTATVTIMPSTGEPQCK